MRVLASLLSRKESGLMDGPDAATTFLRTLARAEARTAAASWPEAVSLCASRALPVERTGGLGRGWRTGQAR